VGNGGEYVRGFAQEPYAVERLSAQMRRGHALDLRGYEPEELRRNWKKCHCPIYVCGMLDGTFQRNNTKKTPNAINCGLARDQI